MCGIQREADFFIIIFLSIQSDNITMNDIGFFPYNLDNDFYNAISKTNFKLLKQLVG